MKNSTTKSVALVVMWFFLVNILLSTSSSATGSIFSIALSFRGLVRGYIFYSEPLLMGIYLTGLALLIWLILFILMYLLRAWSSIIEISKHLLKYFVFDDQSEQKDFVAESNMLERIFGEDILTSKDSLFWKATRSIVLIWAITIIISIISGILFATSSY